MDHRNCPDCKQPCLKKEGVLHQSYGEQKTTVWHCPPCGYKRWDPLPATR